MYKIQILNKFTGWDSFKHKKTKKTQYFLTKSNAMRIITVFLGNIKNIRIVNTEDKKIVFER